MATFPDCIRKRQEIDLPYPDVHGYLVQGKNEQIIFMKFDKETLIPEHSHAEQWELVVEGSVDMILGGKTKTYTRGDCFFIPKGTPHSAVVHKGYHSVIFFDQLDRYYAKKNR